MRLDHQADEDGVASVHCIHSGSLKASYISYSPLSSLPVHVALSILPYFASICFFLYKEVFCLERFSLKFP